MGVGGMWVYFWHLEVVSFASFPRTYISRQFLSTFPERYLSYPFTLLCLAWWAKATSNTPMDDITMIDHGVR